MSRITILGTLDSEAKKKQQNKQRKPMNYKV